MKTPKICCLLTAIALAQSSLFGVSTAPVGFVSVSVPAASDAALGAPMSRASEFQGVVDSINVDVVTMSGTPNWTTNQFAYVQGVQAKTFFVRIDSGTKEGLTLTITENDVNSVKVSIPAGEDLSGISVGEQISISPYWTPSTLVTGVLPGTQILRYSTSTPGTNLSASATYVFNGTNWLQGTTNVNDVPFGVNEGFTLRNNSTTVAQTISITGSVPMTSHRARLYTLAPSTTQDIRMFYNSPIPETIGNAFPSGSLAPGDRLLAFDNSATGKNKSASTTLVWSGSAWLQGSTNVTTTYQLTPGSSYIFRKNQTGASAASVVWSDLPSYLQP
jgi:uncharacterized protein (TIGR02597 family)